MLRDSPRTWPAILGVALVTVMALPPGAGTAPCQSIFGGTATASGCEAWTATFDGGGDDQAHALVASPDGSHVYLASRGYHKTDGPEIHLVAYALDGTITWSTSHQALDLLPQSVFSTTRSLIVSSDGAHIYLVGYMDVTAMPQTFVLAYAARDGSLEWWATQEPGTTGESVAISHDGKTVYVTGGSNLNLLTAALDAATGVEKWRAIYDNHVQITSTWHESAFGIATSPDDATLYVTGTSAATAGNLEHVTIALRASDGATQWITRFSATNAITGTTLDAEGYAITPSPDGATLYVHGTVGTYALDAPTGTQRWSATDAACRSHYPIFFPTECALALDAANNRIVALGYNEVAAYEATTGRILWQIPLHSGSDTNGATRAMVLSPDTSRLYMVTPAGKGYVTDATLDWSYETQSLDAATGRLIWRTTYGEHIGSRGIAISPEGNRVFVTGEYHPRVGSVDIVTAAYDTQLGLENAPRLPPL
jgi:outer membrane protein assembly factor BamB